MTNIIKMLTVVCMALSASSAFGAVTYLNEVVIDPSFSDPILATTYAPVDTTAPGYQSNLEGRVYLHAAGSTTGYLVHRTIDTVTGAPQYGPAAILVDGSSTTAIFDRGIGTAKLYAYTLTGQLYAYSYGTGSLSASSPYIDSLVEVFSIAAARESVLTALGIGLDGPTGALGWSIDTETGDVVAIFGFDGNASGDGPGQFNNARYHTYGPNGLCYVLDYGNNRMQVLDPDNGYAYVSEFALQPGSPNMQFAIGFDGNLYLGDGAGGGFAYDASGNYLGSFSLPPGSYSNPFTGDQPNRSLAASTDGHLFVFDTTGAHRYVIEEAPTTTTTAEPTTTTTVAPTTTTAEPTTTTAEPTTTTTLEEPEALCGAAPRTGCFAAAAGKASVLLSSPSDPAKRKLKFKWKGGDAVAAADFGNPVASSAPQYRLCIYDSSASAQPLAQAMIPSGACGADTCWKAAGDGFKFKHATASPQGITSVLLKPGIAGKSQVKVGGKGSTLPLATLGLTNPVTVQFVADNGTSVACWQTAFTAATANDPDAYKAKGP